MLNHHYASPHTPARVCILGGEGFVASAIAQTLADRTEVLRIGQKELDLTSPEAGTQLANRLQPEDVLIFVAAKAPCKTPQSLMDNIAMARAVAEAIGQTPPAHLVYISSDAVYRDDLELRREGDCAQPGSLHGVMHLAREVLLRTVCKMPLAILRPSLLYGATDPHNGYGPNQYMRAAAAGKTITLFGEGEEKRDHIWITDVAEVVRRVVEHRSAGVLNIATGHSVSFRAVAEQVVALFDTPVAIQGTPRKNPITHQHYDITACLKAFPDFHYTPLSDGLTAVYRQGMKER